MFTPVDRIAEIISYFVGMSTARIDAMRLREAHPEGEHESAPGDPLALPAGAQRPFSTDAVPVTPIDQAYEDIAADMVALRLRLEGEFGSIPYDVDGPPTLDQVHIGPRFPTSDWPGLDYEAGPAIGAEPGQFAAVIWQHRVLYDQDVVVVGNPDFAIPEIADSTPFLVSAITDVKAQLSALLDLEPTLDQAQLADFLRDTHAQIVATPEIEATASGEALSGVWVNGQGIATAPLLGDYLPQAETDDGAAPGVTATSEVTLVPDLMDVKMTVSSGENLSVNDAVIISKGLSGNVLAVAGDCYRLDVIIQVNAISTDVAAAPGFEELCALTASDDVAFNIAKFTQPAPATPASPETADPADGPPVMPVNWQITHVDGDLTFMSWLYQYSFVIDDDVLVLCATGTNTTIGTGANAGYNTSAVAYLAQNYDLILVGGSLYDLNYIGQTNILYDHDTLSVMGAMGGSDGQALAGGNLLWNQAEITHAGQTLWQAGVPIHYADTMAGLDAGDMTMPASLAADPSFQGIEGLRVLYVTGNIYDVNIIKQVNVTGDADQVVLYANAALEKPVDWDISTGGNMLVNAAIIVDSDTLGATAHVGGTMYSEAILIQTEIVDWAQCPVPSEAPVVSELVAFLDQDASAFESTGPDTVSPTAVPADPMEAMLA